jgi:hypothetical protein
VYRQPYLVEVHEVVEVAPPAVPLPPKVRPRLGLVVSEPATSPRPAAGLEARRHGGTARGLGLAGLAQRRGRVTYRFITRPFPQHPEAGQLPSDVWSSVLPPLRSGTNKLKLKANF